MGRDRRNRGLPDVRAGRGHRRASVVAQSPDAAERHHLVQFVLLDLRAQVRARPRPLQLLDDPVVHVGDIQRPVRSVADVHGAEQLIDARQELRARVHVAQLGEPFDVVDRRAADETPDGLGEEQLPFEVRRQAVAAEDRGARRGGKVVQVLRRHARAENPALHVADARRGPHHREILLEPVLHPRRAVRIRPRRRGRRRGVAPAAAEAASPRGWARRERPVMNGKLEVHRPPFAARVDEPRLPVIVRRETPLPAIRARRLAEESRRGPADAERVVGRVDPVVHVPQQAGFLVLDVGVAALADPREDDLALVGHAVRVRVRPLHDLVGIGFAGEDDAVLKRQDHARRDDAIDEDGVLVVHAVSFGALPAADAADGVVLAGGLGVHHVADELADVHAAVAVELDHGRADHLGVRRDELHAIAGGEDEAARFLFRAPRHVRRLRGEVRRIVARRSAPAAEPATSLRRAGHLFGGRAGHLRGRGRLPRRLRDALECGGRGCNHECRGRRGDASQHCTNETDHRITPGTRLAAGKPGDYTRPSGQRRGSSLMIEALSLFPTQKVTGVVELSTNTRRMFVC